MSKRVSYKVYGDDAKHLTDFANAVGQPLDKIAKVALYKYVSEVLDRADQLAKDERIKAIKDEAHAIEATVVDSNTESSEP